jgi:hypothetical protein
MARGRQRSGPAVSLFSFLDILAGLIGTLTLIISGMTVFAMTTSEQILKLEDVEASAKKPRFVECSRDGLILHPERVAVPLADLDQDDGPWQTELAAVARNKARQYVLFLIRPDGLRSFDRAKAMADASGIDVGYDPVYSAGPVRLVPPEGGRTP